MNREPFSFPRAFHFGIYIVRIHLHPPHRTHPYPRIDRSHLETSPNSAKKRMSHTQMAHLSPTITSIPIVIGSPLAGVGVLIEKYSQMDFICSEKTPRRGSSIVFSYVPLCTPLCRHFSTNRATYKSQNFRNN
jgi:hypothetical protein